MRHTEKLIRSFVLRAGAAMLALLVGLGGAPLPAAAQAPGKPITAHWYPGLIGSNMKRSFIDTFESPASIKVIESFDNPRFTQMQANRSNPNADIAAFIDVILPLVARSGLITPLDPAGIPNLRLVNPQVRAKGDTHVPLTYGTWGIVYNTSKVTKPITSWADLWREDLTGHVSSPNITYNSSLFMLDALARLRGGSLQDPEQGFELMRRVRLAGPGLWDQESIAIGWLKTQEIWVTPYFSGSVLVLMQDPDLPKLKFVVPKEGGYYVSLNVTKVANSPNPAGADQFINHMLSVGPQEAWARFGRSRPVNVNAAVPREVQETVPAPGELRRLDWEYFARVRNEVVKRWNEVVNR